MKEGPYTASMSENAYMGGANESFAPPPPNKNQSKIFHTQPIDLKFSGSSELDVKRSNPGF